jgi:hypothetical protein
VDGNVQAYAGNADGSLYVLGTDANLWLEAPGWLTNGGLWSTGQFYTFAAA